MILKTGVFFFCTFLFSLTESTSTGPNTGNWLQLDLGREFEVKKVVIYPVHFGEDLPLDLMDRKSKYRLFHCTIRRQIDIVTYQVRKIKAYTSLCLFVDEFMSEVKQ